MENKKINVSSLEQTKTSIKIFEKFKNIPYSISKFGLVRTPKLLVLKGCKVILPPVILL